MSDNSIVKVVGTGTVRLACRIILYECRHLPSASRNLIFGSVLTRGMRMRIFAYGKSDAVTDSLPKRCPAVSIKMA